ncbi:FAD-binding oxidoreductase [bacterium]|nr:FAD-binding oxidoreductase [bacterium]
MGVCRLSAISALKVQRIFFLILFIIYSSITFSTVRIVTATSKDYDNERVCLNKKFNLYPSVIYFCQSAEDVVQAIQMAKKQHKKIRIRSGNHSFEAFSNGNDVAIIDVSLIKTLQLSQDKKIVTVGAGEKLLEIYQYLWKSRLTIPGGSCPDVGISGLVLGGGIGVASRKMGLTCDNVVEYQMVIATGDIITVRADNPYRDLFWALCGAGNGNFGVITSIKLKTYPVDKVTVYHVVLNWKKMHEASDAWFQLLKNAPRELTLFLIFEKSNGHKPTLSSFGQFFGTPETLQNIIKPLLQFSNQSTLSMQEMNYMEAIQHWAGGASTLPTYFQGSSVYLKKALSSSTLKSIDRFLSNSNVKNAYVAIDSYGGAIMDVKADDTAFAHRDKLASVQLRITWKEKNQQHLQEKLVLNLRKSFADDGEGAYVNYPDIHLKNWQFLYYGNHFTRLQSIKFKYDPTNLFTYKQAIHATQK